MVAYPSWTVLSALDLFLREWDWDVEPFMASIWYLQPIAALRLGYIKGTGTQPGQKKKLRRHCTMVGDATTRHAPTGKESELDCDRLSRVRVERRVDADRQPPAYLPKTQLRLCRLSPTRQQLQCHPRQLHRPRALFPAQLKSCLKPVCVCPLFSLFFGGLAKKAMLPTLPRFTALVCSHSRDRVAAV